MIITEATWNSEIKEKNENSMSHTHQYKLTTLCLLQGIKGTQSKVQGQSTQKRHTGLGNK